MAIAPGVVDQLTLKYQVLRDHLTERQRRLWAGTEAEALGHGGRRAVALATGMSVNTVSSGQLEVQAMTAGEQEPSLLATEQTRKSGAGRPKAEERDPDLLAALKALVDPATRGDPMGPLLWTSKSTVKLAKELTAQNHPVSSTTVGRLLKEQDYRLQSTRKRFEGKQHPDRDAQFQYINQWVSAFGNSGQPAISVDAKKKELVGNFKAPSGEWQPKGEPVEVNAYDFPSLAEGKAAPYGVYDIFRDEGWVSVGISKDTAQFAVSTIGQWYDRMGRERYPKGTHLLITADSGGSNSSRTWLWKRELQRFSDETGLIITVLHYPAGTSKWNKIEHRMFNHITTNWRGRPLTSFQVVVNCIAATTTTTGLTIAAGLDETTYETGIKPTKEEMENLQIRRHTFHGEWNYTLLPRTDHE